MNGMFRAYDMLVDHLAHIDEAIKQMGKADDGFLRVIKDLRNNDALKAASENGNVGRYKLYKEIAVQLGCSWRTIRRHAIKSSYRDKVKSAAGRQRIFNHEEILKEILSGKRRDDICQAYGRKRSLLSKIYWKHLMEGK